MKYRIIGMISALLLLLSIIIINAYNGNKVLNDFFLLISGEQENDNIISYTVYDNQNDENVKILLNFNSNDGIEYIITPTDDVIYGNSKKNVFIDYTVKLNENYEFLIKPINKNSVTQQINITQEEIDDYFTCNTFNQEYNTKHSVDFKNKLDSDRIYYKISNETGEWKTNIDNIITDLGNIEVFDSDDNKCHSGTTTIHIKKEDRAGNIIYSDVKCNVTATRYTVNQKIEESTRLGWSEILNYNYDWYIPERFYGNIKEIEVGDTWFYCVYDSPKWTTHGYFQIEYLKIDAKDINGNILQKFEMIDNNYSKDDMNPNKSPKIQDIVIPGKINGEDVYSLTVEIGGEHWRNWGSENNSIWNKY